MCQVSRTIEPALTLGIKSRDNLIIMENPSLTKEEVSQEVGDPSCELLEKTRSKKNHSTIDIFLMDGCW